MLKVQFLGTFGPRALQIVPSCHSERGEHRVNLENMEKMENTENMKKMENINQTTENTTFIIQNTLFVN